MDLGAVGGGVKLCATYINCVKQMPAT